MSVGRYLLTTDPAFLEPYEQAVKQVRQRQIVLVLVADEPAQVERMPRIQPLVAHRIEEATGPVREANSL